MILKFRILKILLLQSLVVILVTCADIYSQMKTAVFSLTCVLSAIIGSFVLPPEGTYGGFGDGENGLAKIK